MKTIHLMDADCDFGQLFGEVAKSSAPIAVVGEDGSAIVLLTLAEYNGLRETAHLLSSPANAAHLSQSLEQYRTGQAVERKLIEVSDADPQPPVDE